MENYYYVTAEWARKTSNEILGEEAKSQLEKCFEIIEREAKRNSNSASTTLSLNTVAIRELEKRGFKVNKHDGDPRDVRECGYYTINW